MREIVKAILAAPMPVVGYVAPSGARAASAGTYILYACHIAAMAPATNLGAATPVSLGGSTPAPPTGKGRASGPPMSAEQRKILNDSVAYIRALAELRGRNVEWAEQAVRGAASLPDEDALRAHVVNLIAPDLPSLLSQLNGRRVIVRGHTETLDTTGVTVVWLRPGWRTRVLAVITNPMIAYGLLLIGIWGLIFEGFNPGGVLPGVVGVISLLVALFAFQLLPTDFAGLALIAVGSAMMAGEFFFPTYGSLGLGGLIGFVVGSLILFDAGVPGYVHQPRPDRCDRNCRGTDHPRHRVSWHARPAPAAGDRRAGHGRRHGGGGGGHQRRRPGPGPLRRRALECRRRLVPAARPARAHRKGRGSAVVGRAALRRDIAGRVPCQSF
ncbi:nodulation efficiency protein NfeD [mine drainage metagenome]|uniref:Nodulation efficiency protein NfeD n=1 Tax=mine drainage metagenome TaxID=410659 RepID=T1C3I4_9ZZZZ